MHFFEFFDKRNKIVDNKIPPCFGIHNFLVQVDRCLNSIALFAVNEPFVKWKPVKNFLPVFQYL